MPPTRRPDAVAMPDGVRLGRQAPAAPFPPAPAGAPPAGPEAAATLDPRRMAEELAASEERLRLAIAAGGFATWEAVRISDDEEQIVWSENYFTLLGYPPDPSGRASRSMWRNRVHPDDFDDVMAAWARAEAGDGVFHCTHRLCLPDGTVRWTEARARVMRMPDGRRRSVGIAQDITARHQAEARVRALQERSVRTARLNAVGAMAAALAHELNQPLSAMTNYCAAVTQALKQGVPGDQQAAEWRGQVAMALGSIVEQSQRAASVVRRLRECVASVRPDMGLAGVAGLVADAVAEARRALAPAFDAQRGAAMVQLETAVAPDAGEIFVDREQLTYVLVNLVRNAVEAVRDSEPRRVSVTARRAEDDGAVEISIADTGPGIASGETEQIFNSFASGKPGGMGMGLAICRTLVELHGGTIVAANAPGGGAVFRVRLPVAAAALA